MVATRLNQHHLPLHDASHTLLPWDLGVKWRLCRQGHERAGSNSAQKATDQVPAADEGAHPNHEMPPRTQAGWAIATCATPSPPTHTHTHTSLFFFLDDVACSEPCGDVPLTPLRPSQMLQPESARALRPNLMRWVVKGGKIGATTDGPNAMQLNARDPSRARARATHSRQRNRSEVIQLHSPPPTPETRRKSVGLAAPNQSVHALEQTKRWRGTRATTDGNPQVRSGEHTTRRREAKERSGDGTRGGNRRAQTHTHRPHPLTSP